MTGLVEACGDCSHVKESVCDWTRCSHPESNHKVILQKDYEEGLIPDWCPLPQEWQCQICGTDGGPPICEKCKAPIKPFKYECIYCDLGFISDSYKRCPVICPSCKKGSDTDDKNIVDADLSNVHWRKKRQGYFPDDTDEVKTSKKIIEE